ncbi:hypothetical protein PG999_010159 [Apiospora kogelbergensis]|uniref:Uncharacterized protein n=1 Tax=Apiospora kogelbergensis TaxID=1337665 RepID=A0AAW0QVK6_9PEZI
MAPRKQRTIKLNNAAGKEDDEGQKACPIGAYWPLALREPCDESQEYCDGRQAHQSNTKLEEVADAICEEAIVPRKLPAEMSHKSPCPEGPREDNL